MHGQRDVTTLVTLHRTCKSSCNVFKSHSKASALRTVCVAQMCNLCTSQPSPAQSIALSPRARHRDLLQHTSPRRRAVGASLRAQRRCVADEHELPRAQHRRAHRRRGAGTCAALLARASPPANCQATACGSSCSYSSHASEGMRSLLQGSQHVQHTYTCSTRAAPALRRVCGRRCPLMARGRGARRR
jgi:hypothetical protein